MLKFLAVCSDGVEMEKLAFLLPAGVHTVLGFSSMFRAVILPSIY